MNDGLVVCRASIAQHSKSFALASKLLPSTARDPAAVVYAWCRRADDAIDLAPAETQHTAVLRLSGELEEVYAGQAMADPVLAAFQAVVTRFDIPACYPQELLQGMAMDATGYHYRTWDDLLLYSYRVASTVGLMMCHVMGVSNVAALTHAAHLGLAMQLTNIARDVNEDWQRGRIYLPDALLQRHGMNSLQPGPSTAIDTDTRERLRPALRELLEAADRYYRSGDVGLQYLSARSAFSVGAARWVYSSIGTEIARHGYDVLAPRAVVPRYKKLLLVLKAALKVKSRLSAGPGFHPAQLQAISYDQQLTAL